MRLTIYRYLPATEVLNGMTLHATGLVVDQMLCERRTMGPDRFTFRGYARPIHKRRSSEVYDADADVAVCLTAEEAAKLEAVIANAIETEGAYELSRLPGPLTAAAGEAVQNGDTITDADTGEHLAGPDPDAET